MLRDDYQGPFDPDLSLAGLSRNVLAGLLREYLLAGHLQDRVGIPEVLSRHGTEGVLAVAVDEWMSASPIYSRRMQDLLGFAPPAGPGTGDVTTIFKNLQFDIGSPPQFMDFRFRVESPTYGEFWLDHCGALMDAEPMGETFVHLMCHDIEDPTFDATAAATNPRARIRPIHRPPRQPADRHPHCHWKVSIVEEAEAYGTHPNEALLSDARIATIALDDPGGDGEPLGMRDYAGEFDAELRFEELAHRPLVLLCQEVGVQIHLLARGFLLSVAQRFGADEAAQAGNAQAAGIAGLTAERLLTELDLRDNDADTLAKVLQVHPMFWPRTYVTLRVERQGGDVVRIALGNSPAFDEGDPHSWFALMADQADGGEVPTPFVTIAQAVHPAAELVLVEPGDDEVLACLARVPDTPPPPEAREHRAVSLAKISTGATHVFIRRRAPA